MRQVSISEFKAKCHALLERVRSTGKPIRVTRFGKPLAEIVPANVDEERLAWIGSMKNSMKIKGDIVRRPMMRMSGKSCAIEAVGFVDDPKHGRPMSASVRCYVLRKKAARPKLFS